MQSQDNGGCNRQILSFVGALALIGLVIGFFVNIYFFLVCAVVLIICVLGLNNMRRQATEARLIDLQQQQLALASRPAVIVNPPSVAPAYADPFAAQDDAQMKQASELITAKRYEDARAILLKLDNPTAKEWIAKIDKTRL